MFLSQSYFSVPKEVRLNSTHYLIMKIHNKKELQKLQDIDYKDVLQTYRNYTKEPYSFLTINTALPTNDPIRFRNNFSDSTL